MIDVVFVIMLFFMVMAGAIKVERSIDTRLPRGGAVEGESGDELVFRIDEEGAVFMNDEEMADGSGKDLGNVTRIVTRLGRDAMERRASVLVTLDAEPGAQYQRIVDVLNCLSKAGIKDVVFTVGSDA